MIVLQLLKGTEGILNISLFWNRYLLIRDKNPLKVTVMFTSKDR